MTEVSVGQWAVLNDWDFGVVEITRVSEQCFWHRGMPSSRESRAYKEKILVATTDKAKAELAREQLRSAKAECRRREQAARVWFFDEQEKIKARARDGETHGK